MYDTQDIDSKVCELARRELGIRRRKLVHDIYEEWNPAIWVELCVAGASGSIHGIDSSGYSSSFEVKFNPIQSTNL